MIAILTNVISRKNAEQSPGGLVLSLIVFCLVSIGLLVARITVSDSMRYSFLLWNLVLAIIPALLAWWLVLRVRKYGWLRWQQILLGFVWFVFLPNSFYLVTDFIHLRTNYEASLLFDAIMLTSFACNGLVLGYLSVYLVHRAMLQQVNLRLSYAIIGAIFVACSFATYLGRFTRWNTWDILLKPAGLLFDVSDRFVNPAAHLDTYIITFVFFGLLASAYGVIWQAARILRAS